MKLYKLEKATDGKHKNIVYIKKDEKIYKIQFGAFGMSDFTIHKDEDLKQRYINRHKANESWGKSGILTAGFWSRWYLWNKPTKRDSLEDIKARFNL